MTRLEKLKSLCVARSPYNSAPCETEDLSALLALVEQMADALKLFKSYNPNGRYKKLIEALTAFAAWNENKEDV